MTPHSYPSDFSQTWKGLKPTMATFVTFKPANSEKLSEDEPVLKYKLLTSKAYPPTRETAGSIGYDLRSPRFVRIPLKEAHTTYPWELPSRYQKDIMVDLHPNLD